MLIYHYNSLTAELVSTSEARLDPIDKKPRIPANATSIEPPTVGKKLIALFVNNG